MTKPLIKNPYAFNGSPLTVVKMDTDNRVYTEPKEKNSENCKHFYIVSYGCI